MKLWRKLQDWLGKKPCSADKADSSDSVKPMDPTKVELEAFIQTQEQALGKISRTEKNLKGMLRDSSERIAAYDTMQTELKALDKSFETLQQNLREDGKRYEAEAKQARAEKEQARAEKESLLALEKQWDLLIEQSKALEEKLMKLDKTSPSYMKEKSHLMNEQELLIAKADELEKKGNLSKTTAAGKIVRCEA